MKSIKIKGERQKEIYKFFLKNRKMKVKELWRHHDTKKLYVLECERKDLSTKPSYVCPFCGGKDKFIGRFQDDLELKFLLFMEETKNIRVEDFGYGLDVIFAKIYENLSDLELWNINPEKKPSSWLGVPPDNCQRLRKPKK